MSKKVRSTQTLNVQREADVNVAKVMGKGLYWLVKSMVYIPVQFIETAAKVIKIKKD